MVCRNLRREWQVRGQESVWTAHLRFWEEGSSGPGICVRKDKQAEPSSYLLIGDLREDEVNLVSA